MADRNGGSMENCIGLMALPLSLQMAIKNGTIKECGIEQMDLLVSGQMVFNNGGSMTSCIDWQGLLLSTQMATKNGIS
jgi:hypothetical protein